MILNLINISICQAASTAAQGAQEPLVRVVITPVQDTHDEKDNKHDAEAKNGALKTSVNKKYSHFARMNGPELFLERLSSQPLQNLFTTLKDRASLEANGIKIPKLVLLYGRPASGKSSMITSFLQQLRSYESLFCAVRVRETWGEHGASSVPSFMRHFKQMNQDIYSHTKKYAQERRKNYLGVLYIEDFHSFFHT